MEQYLLEGANDVAVHFWAFPGHVVMTPTKQYDPIVLYYVLKADVSLPAEKYAHKESYYFIINTLSTTMAASSHVNYRTQSVHAYNALLVSRRLQRINEFS